MTLGDVLGLVVFHHVLEALQLYHQLALLTGQGVQLPPQPIDVGLKVGIKVPAPCSWAALLLQELPLGVQDPVLLLKEADLNDCGMEKRVRLFPKASFYHLFPPCFPYFLPI